MSFEEKYNNIIKPLYKEEYSEDDIFYDDNCLNWHHELSIPTNIGLILQM